MTIYFGQVFVPRIFKFRFSTNYVLSAPLLKKKNLIKMT